MKWKTFQHGGQQYDLSHLHPFDLTLIQPGSEDKPDRRYEFAVRFSLHCFTRTTQAGDDPALRYQDNRERRTFCFDRYRLSFQLPAIIRAIHQKRCLHTGHGNFFIVELTTDNGQTVEYEVYFDVSKRRRNVLELFVQSAYVRQPASRPYRHAPKKIGFFVIAHNRLVGKPIKTPK